MINIIKQYKIVILFFFSFLLWGGFEVLSPYPHKIFFYLLLQTTLFYYFYNITCSNKIARFILSIIVAFFCFSVPAVGLVFYLNFGQVMGVMQLNAVFQTNFTESREFIDCFISFKWVILYMGISIGAWCILFFNKEFINIKKRRHIIILSLVFVEFLVLNFFSKKSKPNIYRTVYAYHKELSEWRKVAAKRKITNELDGKKSERDEVHVVVIGESLNKNHMGLYGYFRENNPLLAKRDNLLIYKDVVASCVGTNICLSKGLTNSSNSKNISFSKAPSIIEIANSADIETYWLSNQVKMGIWDNHVSVLADSANEVIFTNSSVGQSVESSRFDEILIGLFEDKVKKKTDKTKLIFIHLMGNHGGYCLRFPKSFEKFKMKKSRGFLGGNGEEVDLNNLDCYDNATFYNDYVVDTFIEKLKKLKKVSTLIYFSDHSENLLESLNHESSNFRHDMVEVPLMIWYSEKYKKRYGNKIKVASQSLNNPFMLDDLFHLFFDLFNIQSSYYKPQMSLINTGFIPIKSRVICGGINYDGSNNRLRNVRLNYKEIKNSFSKIKFYLHRVNSMGKLSEALTLGVDNFELDIYLDRKKWVFQVGHDPNAMSGFTLDEMLAYIKKRKGKGVTLWLDFKNYHPKYISQTQKRLSYLLKKYRFLKGSILETSRIDSTFSKRFGQDFNTFFYLPTNDILQAMASKSEDHKKRVALKLVKKANETGAQTISFDSRLYPFVTRYMTKDLNRGIQYAIFDLSFTLEGGDLNKSIREREYFTDKRNRSLIFTYNSFFNL